MLSNEHNTATSSAVSGPVKEKARRPKVFDFVKGMRKVFVSEMVRNCLEEW